MIRINKQSTAQFKQNKDKVLNYLLNRGVDSKTYLDIIKNRPFGLLAENIFYIGEKIDGSEYTLEFFFTDEATISPDIETVNRNLQTDYGDILSIANVCGEDIICMNIKTGQIFLWELESGSGDMVPIAKSIDQFIAMIIYK